MKKVALVLVLIITAQVGKTQKKEDVVYLKDGSIIRGLVTTDTAKNKIKILNHTGDVWVFDKDKVDSVTREKPFQYRALVFNKNGFEYKIDGGILARSSEHSIGKEVVPSFDFTFGYRLNYFALAAGTGLQFYNQMQVPLFGELRLRMSNRDLSPLVFIKLGHSFPAEKRDNDWSYSYKSYGGFAFTSGFGIESIIGENTSILFSVCYHYQELNYKVTPLWPGDFERNRTEKFNRIEFSFGLLFK